MRRLKLQEVRRDNAKAFRDLPCFVYPQGHKGERIFFCEEKGKIKVCALASHHDGSYERTIRQGMRCRKEENFIPFEGGKEVEPAV